MTLTHETEPPEDMDEGINDQIMQDSLYEECYHGLNRSNKKLHGALIVVMDILYDDFVEDLETKAGEAKAEAMHDEGLI